MTPHLALLCVLDSCLSCRPGKFNLETTRFFALPLHLPLHLFHALFRHHRKPTWLALCSWHTAHTCPTRLYVSEGHRKEGGDTVNISCVSASTFTFAREATVYLCAHICRACTCVCAGRPTLEATYTASSFRAVRFLSWCRRDASVQRFVERIKEKFGARSNQEPGKGDEDVLPPSIVIFYGDWGHLRHQAPSPGIGLRRLLEASDGIVTVTVHESYTSSFCPNCEGHVSESRGSHGLLKCDHEKHCGTYWSRDVLGALNIRTKGIHLWNNASPHYLFGG